MWNFSFGTGDGFAPYDGLIADKSGNLYGTTYGGGANGDGTVFELNPPTGKRTRWRERVLWSFVGSPDDGENPYAALVAEKWGNLYGTTVGGGANCPSCGFCGTTFELSPPFGKSAQWSETVLWSFGASGDGSSPSAGLLADKWGNLYSTTAYGGAGGICSGRLWLGHGLRAESASRPAKTMERARAVGLRR